MLCLNLNQTFTDRVVESYNDLYAKGYRGAVEFTIFDPILKKNIGVEVKPESQVADVKKELLQYKKDGTQRTGSFTGSHVTIHAESDRDLSGLDV